MTAFDYPAFRAALDALLPVERAQAIFPAIRSLPVGSRAGRYVREPGNDRWICEYTSMRRDRAGIEHVSHHRTITSAWSVAMDVGFPSKHREAEIDEIARIAHGLMLAQGLTRLTDPGTGADMPALPEPDPDETAEVAAIGRARTAPPILSGDDLWRRQYREAMATTRIMGVQHDLFDAAAVTHYHRHPRRPSFEMPPAETIAAKLDRIKGDPFATFGPPDDRAPMSADEKADMLRSAANWLRIGQRVRVRDSARSIDGSTERRVLGRLGVVWRLCSSVFEDHVYIFLDPARGERTEKIIFIEIRHLDPVE